MDYLLKASAVIAIFYFCYKLFLQGETFFSTNRWFLLSGLIVAICIPFIVIPIYIEYTPTPIHDFIITESNGIGSQSNPESQFNWTFIVSWSYYIGAMFFLGKLCIEFVSLSFIFKNNKSI